MRIPIVNEQDELIEYKDLNDRTTKDICRVSALWVVSSDDKILLARRALNKKNSPGLWGPAVGGTVEEGETYEVNIIKEAGEEIGLLNIKTKREYKIRSSTTHEYFCQWFSVKVDKDYKFKKQDSEVEALEWFEKGQLLDLYNKNPGKFVPSFSYTINYFLINANQS
jgi:isopentenyldiphosphate isomerase